MVHLAQLERRMQILSYWKKLFLMWLGALSAKVCVFISFLHLLSFLDPCEEQLLVDIDQSIFVFSKMADINLNTWLLCNPPNPWSHWGKKPYLFNNRRKTMWCISSKPVLRHPAFRQNNSETCKESKNIGLLKYLFFLWHCESFELLFLQSVITKYSSVSFGVSCGGTTHLINRGYICLNKFLQKVTFLRRCHDNIAQEAKLGFPSFTFN